MIFNDTEIFEIILNEDKTELVGMRKIDTLCSKTINLSGDEAKPYTITLSYAKEINSNGEECYRFIPYNFIYPVLVLNPNKKA